MLRVATENKVLEALDNYLELVTKTGYARKGMTDRLLAYLFLVDFTETMSIYFDEDEYRIVSGALSKLFGNCLLPYPVFCTNRVKIGMPYYMGVLKNRVTEGTRAAYRKDRYTEDGIIRVI